MWNNVTLDESTPSVSKSCNSTTEEVYQDVNENFSYIYIYYVYIYVYYIYIYISKYLSIYLSVILTNKPFANKMGKSTKY